MATAAEKLKELKEAPSLEEELGIVSAAEAIAYLNLLVYGDPGAGKTRLAGTASEDPRTSPVLIVDVEGGVTTLRKSKDIKVLSVRSIDEIVTLHNRLHKTGNAGGYGTICIDSLTELQKLDMRTIMKEVVAARPDLDEDVPSQREWGKSGERIRRIVRAYRDLPTNVIFTALASSERDNNNVLMFAPDLPGKLKKAIPGFMDIVGYLYAETEDDTITRKLQVTGTRRVIAKDRTDSLGGLIVNPTIPEMWETIHS